MNPIGMQNLNDTEPGGLLTSEDFKPRRPVVIPTRRTLIARIWRAVQRGVLRWEIGANEQWLLDCEHDGVLTPRMRRQVEAQTQEMRVRLAVLEQS